MWCECKNGKEQNICEKYYIWNPTTCSSENVEYLSTINDLVITYDEVINGSANVMGTASSNFHKKIRYEMDCYIFHIVLLLIILLLIIAIIYYHYDSKWYAKHRSKLKNMLSC